MVMASGSSNSLINSRPRLEPKPSSPPPSLHPPMEVYHNVVYYPNWAARIGKTPGTLKIDAITMIYYAFAQLSANGVVELGDPWLDDQVEIDGTTGAIRACLALKARNNRLKVILSIGGGHGSQHFRQVAASPELRDVCADSARQLVDHYGLDGIDVDWEHPNGVRQCRDYISLLAKMRTYFPTPRYICTSAIPGHDWAYRQLNVLHASQYLDLINLMCYDFTTNMSAQTGHQAQLDRSNLPCTPLNAPSGKAAVTHLRTSGVPGHKILLGIPAYGRCFRGTTGVDQPFTRYVANERVIPYCDLPLPNSVEQVDRAAVAAYCFSEAIGFVTYDNPVTVMMKADFVKANRLAGLFYWEGTGDIDNPRSLVLAGYDGLFPA